MLTNKKVFISLSMRVTRIPNLALTLSYICGCSVRLGLHYTQQRQLYKVLTYVYSTPCQTSRMVYFAIMVKGLKLLTIFAKYSILHVSQGSEYASGFNSVH